MSTTLKYPTSINACQKTLDAALLAGVTAAVTLNSVVGIQNKAGVFVVDRVDANGTATPSKREYITFTGVSGSTLTTLVRNADGGGTDQDHAVGAIVEFVSDVLQEQAIIDGLLNVVTTAGALDTTKVVDLTTAQTLTNKTLTSPVFQGNVDGWISANETWTYASASTITVPSGAASKYAIGDKIKFTQHGAVKYFYIITVADTVLTVRGNGAVVVEDTGTYAITLNYYSHQESPIGFPTYFIYTPTQTPQAGTYTSIRNLDIYFRLVGNFVTLIFAFDGTCSGTPTYIDLSLPINSIFTEQEQPCLVNHVPGEVLIQATVARISKIGGNWTTGAYSKGSGCITYKIS